MIEFQTEATGALNESGLRLVACKIEESPPPSGDNLFCRGYRIEEAVYLSDRIIGFTARPGRIKQITTIRLGHPRPFEVKQSPEFNGYVREIWKLIEEEVLASMGMPKETTSHNSMV